MSVSAEGLHSVAVPGRALGFRHRFGHACCFDLVLWAESLRRPSPPPSSIEDKTNTIKLDSNKTLGSAAIAIKSFSRHAQIGRERHNVLYT